MHMKNIEIKPRHHFGHFRSKNKIVRRVFEQGIPRYFYLMETNVGLGRDQPDRLGVRDEMDLVPALCEFQAELSGHNSTAAIDVRPPWVVVARHPAPGR